MYLFLIKYSALDDYMLLLIRSSPLACPVKWEIWASLQKVATALCVCMHSILIISFSGKRTSGAAVSHLNPKTVHPAVPCRVLFWLGGSPMGRVLMSRPLLHWGTAVLQLCDGLCEIGHNFCLLLVSCDQLVDCIILLDGGICQVVKQHGHLLCRDDFLCSYLIGKGQVARGHAVDVAHSHKHGCPVILSAVPRMVKEGTAFSLLPCKHHVSAVESMLGSGHHHHFLGDGHTCVLCKSLALQMIARVDGK
jgi:hypothetical protein